MKVIQLILVGLRILEWFTQYVDDEKAKKELMVKFDDILGLFQSKLADRISDRARRALAARERVRQLAKERESSGEPTGGRTG